MRADEPKCGWRTAIVLYYPPLCCKSKQTDGQSDLFMNGALPTSYVFIWTVFDVIYLDVTFAALTILERLLERLIFKRHRRTIRKKVTRARVSSNARCESNGMSKGRCANRGKINNVDWCKYSVKKYYSKLKFNKGLFYYVRKSIDFEKHSELWNIYIYTNLFSIQCARNYKIK